MATSKEISRFGKGSDFYEEISEVCQPCSVEGKRLQADLFCVECQNYLCKKCWAHHKALRATQSHDLVTIDEAKKVKPAPIKDKCSYKCNAHDDKSFKYFCVSHSSLGCIVCMTMDHKQCQNIEYIPKVAANIRNLDSFKKFDKKLKSLETTCKAIITDVKNNLKQIGADERQMKEAIKEFREKINKVFDKFESELLEKAKQINLEETNKLNVLSNELATSLADVDTILKQVDTLVSSGKNCDTYVLMRKEASHLEALDDAIVNTTKGKTYQRYEFQPNSELFKTGSLGKLSSRLENVSLISEKNLSSPSTGVPAKKAVYVSSPGTDVTSRSKQIQPGTRVRFIGREYGWMFDGTVEHYDSSRGRWQVRWDHGGPNYCSTRELEILPERQPRQAQHGSHCITYSVNPYQSIR